MDAILGTWKNKRGSAKNMKEFMDACKVPEAMRDRFTSREYEVTYSKGEGENCFKCAVTVTNDPSVPDKEYTFQIGKECEGEDSDGRKFKATIDWDGTQFVETYKYMGPSGIKVDMTRKVVDGVVKLTMTCNGATSTNEWTKC